MAIRLRHTGRTEDEPAPTSPSTVWMGWLQQTASLVYLVGGAFLLYQYWARMRRQIVLITGILFVLYGMYRFHLVRRSSRRR